VEEDIILTKNDQFLLIQVNEDGTIVQANCMGVIDVIDGLADNVKLLSEKINVPIDETISAIGKLAKAKSVEEFKNIRN
jgi:inorganic pyrophosphatase